MGLWGRFKRLAAANLRELVEQTQDPEVKLLEFAGEVERLYGEVKAELVDAANAAARLERQLLETKSETELWERKARAAVRQGEDDLAREALSRGARFAALAAHQRVQLAEQLELAHSFSKTLEDLEAKLAEVRRERDSLLARASRAAAASRVGDALKETGLVTSDPAAARLAEEILQGKSRAEAYRRLFDSSLETQFRRLEAGPGVEEELKRLKEEAG